MQVWNKGDKRTRLISLAKPGGRQGSGDGSALESQQDVESEAIFVYKSSDQVCSLGGVGGQIESHTRQHTWGARHWLQGVSAGWRLQG